MMEMRRAEHEEPRDLVAEWRGATKSPRSRKPWSPSRPPTRKTDPVCVTQKSLPQINVSPRKPFVLLKLTRQRVPLDHLLLS